MKQSPQIQLRFLIPALATLLGLFSTDLAHAGYFEISGGFFYSKRKYSLHDYSWSRRIGGSVAFNFTEFSQIEASYQVIVEKTYISSYEDTRYTDQVYSLNWVQSLLSRKSPVQPYVKLGIGQLNRTAEGSYANGLSPARKIDSVTGVLGGGLRIFFSQRMAIKTEATSYLTGGRIESWQDNIGWNIGLSFMF